MNRHHPERTEFTSLKTVNWKAKWKESRVGGVVGAALATVLGICFLVFRVGDGLTRLSFDLPFALRPDIKPEGVVIIYMDEESHTALKQPFFAAWDRAIHARLLEQLKACSVKAVAFDVLFDATTTNDARFIRAVKDHGRVVVGARFTPIRVERRIDVWRLLLPFDDLQRVAAWGVAEGAEPDEVVRWHYRVARHSTNLVSMAWKTAELTAAGPMPDPLTPRWLNYYGPPESIPWVSYVRVLSSDVPLATLSNKVVFVGALIRTGFSGGRGTDYFRTPYSRWTGTRSPGVELNATAYLNLVRGDWLTRLSPPREFLLFIGVGVLFGFGLALFRPVAVGVISVVGVLAVFAVGCVLAGRHQLWFPWAIASAVQIPCAAVCAILLRAQKLHKEKRTLEQMLAAIGGPASAPAAGPSPAAAAAALTPSVLVQQHVRELFHTPSPGGLGSGAATVVGVTAAPVVPDCVLLRRIGLGAYGEVWLGTNVLGAYRAIKIVYRHNFHEARPYEREFEGIKHFDPISRNHPGLVHLLHIGRNDANAYFYYLMELADDASGAQPFDPEKYEPKTLGKELHRRGRLPVDECIQLGLALTDSLNYLHERGLIHRDIKPSNIIFVEGRPKLADIGLVTQIGEGRTFVGTEGFYPPEGPGSPAGDVYSLGKVLYEALTGFNRQHFPDLPMQIDAPADGKRFNLFNKIILRACESNVRKRYATAREMHEDLQALARRRTGWRNFFKKRP